MPSRYAYTPRVAGGRAIGTVSTSSKIFNGVESGIIKFTAVVLKKGQRLDHIAATAYGSASYWWIIAAASGIGWGNAAAARNNLKSAKESWANIRLYKVR